MANAVRAWRKRNRERVPRKNITLNHKAWLYVSAVAKRDSVTISQLLITRLEQEYLALPLDEEA